MRQKRFAPILIIIILITIIGLVIFLYKYYDKLPFAILLPKNSSQTSYIPNSYSDQANIRLSWGNGKLIKTSTEKYSEVDNGISSPLIEGRDVNIDTYEYKDKRIVKKTISIDDFTTLDIWQYDSPYTLDGGIQDFSIFRGYENYTYSATPVKIIVDSWKDSYKTKNNIDMYYEYFFTPKSIGTIGLSSFWAYFPNIENSKPSMVTIYYSDIEGFAKEKNDPVIIQAKKKLNEIADTFSIGKSE